MNVIKINTSFNKKRLLLNALPYSAFLLITLNVGLDFEYSFVPIIIILGIITFIIRESIKFHILEWCFILLAIMSSISIFSYQNVSNFKEIIFFLVIAAGAFFARKRDSEEISKVATWVIIIYLAIGILDFFLPAFAELKSKILTRSNYDSLGLRGVSSLATEPSYFALVVFSCWLMYYSGRNFTDISIKFFMLCAACLILSKSAMALLVLPILIITLDYKYRKYFIFIGVILFFLFLYKMSDSSRAGQVLTMLVNADYEILLRDESAGSRFYFTFKDFYISYDYLFFPFGPGSYDSVIDTINLEKIIPAHLINVYKFEMSGSLFGRFLLEYGFFIFFFVIYVSYRSVLKIGVLKSLILLPLFFLIYTQMISLVFAPVSFSIGMFLYALIKDDENGR